MKTSPCQASPKGSLAKGCVLGCPSTTRHARCCPHHAFTFYPSAGPLVVGSSVRPLAGPLVGPLVGPVVGPVVGSLVGPLVSPLVASLSPTPHPPSPVEAGQQSPQHHEIQIDDNLHRRIGKGLGRVRLPPLPVAALHAVRSRRRCSLPTGKKNCLHFSICACHPCAGAMLIFSVSFQF